MLEELRKAVWEANLSLVTYDLVKFTWGNVSGLSDDGQYVVIKPSGVPYDSLKAEDLVIVDREGAVVEGTLRPSSDLQTHLVLYNVFSGIGGVVHTHSRWATIFAQRKADIPCLGTTHCDTFGGAVPCTPLLSPEQIRGAYEKETGNAIVSCLQARNIDPSVIPAANVASHGPFCWGKDCHDAVYHAAVLEECAMMAWHTMIGGSAEPVQPELLERHFFRKHGPNAYYGQG